ncbi:ankyrin repeat-containing domain protein [Xylaria digitata]|nr:ankyrin repeat-containing domain protein [Xylaria digitata]
MSTSKGEATKEDLLKKKFLIRHLYYDKNLTREQVKAELQKGGLDVSLPTLDSTMRAWGFEKNISKATWKSVASILGKRGQEGKESEVIHRGKRVKPSRIRKETNRHQDNPTFGRPTQPQSPPPLSLGSQVAVCTPPPHPMEFQWRGDLPWQEFVKGEPYEMLHGIVTERQAQRTEDSDIVMIQQDNYPTLLGIGVPYDSSRTSNGSSLPVSKFAARIGTTIPEAYPEENLRRAQCLLRGSRDEEFVFECLTLLIYAFSNNTIDPYSLEFCSQWEVALNIIKNSDILNRVVDLKRINNTTINGFAEKLFYASLYQIRAFYWIQHKSKAVAIVTWLLKSGQNPNHALLAPKGSDGHPQSPLQLVIEMGHVELVEHLLKAKADANIVPSYYGIPSLPLSPLEMAAMHGSCAILPMLLKHGASANINQALHTAIRRSNMENARLLLEHGANPYAAYKTQHGPVYEDTALSVAAATGSRELQFVLEQIASRSPNKTPSSLITVDTLIAAAKRNDSVAFLRQHQLLGTSATNGHGITALHAAILESNISYCESLLPSYDLRILPTPIPPLWLACLRENKDITSLFIKNGADVNGAARLSERHREFLGLGAYHKLDTTPIECIMNGDLVSYGKLTCAAMLIEAGATLTGSELFIAATRLHLDLLSAALAAGANPNASDNKGKRPLQLAIEASEHLDLKRPIVKELVHNGAIASQEEVIASIHDYMNSSFLELLLSHGGNLMDSNREGITPLEAAIYNNDSGLMNTILERHPQIYDPGSICAALDITAYSIAQRLVANRPTQDPLDIVETTALGMAAIRNNFEVFQELLKYPTPSKVSYLPKQPRSYGPFWRENHGDRGSPLALVTMFSDDGEQDAFSAFCELLQRDFQPDRHTWLAIAKQSKVHYAKTLLDKGYELPLDEPPIPDIDPLCASIRHRDLDMFKILLEAGANSIRQHPCSVHLLTTVKYAEWSMMESLLVAGVDVNGHSPQNPTALQLAIEFGELEAVISLLDAGANVNSHSPQGLNALQLAVRYGRLGIINLLLGAGANVNSHSPQGLTALQLAVESGKMVIINHLLNAGADVNQWNQDIKFARSPLQSAIEQVNPEIIDRLLRAGADVNAPPAPRYGATALQLAAMKGHVGLAQHMLELGANIDAPGAKVFGRTALEGAAQHGRIDMLQLLLTHGACVTGTGRRQYIRSIILTNSRVLHYTAQKLLLAWGGWSDSDEKDLQVEKQKLHEEFVPGNIY